MARSIICSTEAETRDFATEVAKALKGGEVLCLHGELGTGKTAFTSFLAQALGVKERVMSPTFVLLRSYETTHPVIKHLHHLDAYRLETREDFESLGFEDLLSPEDLIVIEWAEKVEEWLPKGRRVHIKFDILGETARKIEVLVSSPT